MSTDIALHERKADVQAALQLDSQPTDDFMALLTELGDGDVVTGPMAPTPPRTDAPGEMALRIPQSGA